MTSRPWLAHYDAGVPPTLAPYPANTLLEHVAAAAAERASHPAVLFKGARLTYGELERQSTAFAAALAALGVSKGDRVALLLPNCPQFLVAELGAWKIGAIVTPLNPTYTDRELTHALAMTGAETIVTLTRFYANLATLRPHTRLRRVVATNIKEYLPPLLRLLYSIAREKQQGDRIRLLPGDLWFQDLLRKHRRSERPDVYVAPDDPALIMMSGGTTGTPKGAVVLHGSLVASGLQLRAWLHSILRPWEETILLPLPLFHIYANAGAQTAALIGRNPLALVPNPREVDDLVKTVIRTRPAMLVSVPALFNAMLKHPDVRSGKADFRSIRACFSGAAALLAENKRRFEALTGGRIVEGYSLTEAGMACCVNPVQGPDKLGSVGMPLPDVELRIVDEETAAHDMDVGEVGEVILRAPQLMAGYWRNEEETRAMLRSNGDGAPWLFTGDLGYLDEDGYLFLVDRKKDLIKVNGMQVWPREIEEVIATHPAVAEVGVAGVPDGRKGERVKAWIVLRPGGAATDAEIRAHCQQSLARFKVPSEIEFRDDLPKNMVGKVLRRVLRAESAAANVKAASRA